MVHVLATIRIKHGCMAAYLEILKANVPLVKAENGCLDYTPAIDIESGLPPQVLDPNRVVIIEKWTSLETLRIHLAAPHMAAYREKVKNLVDGVSLNVLQNV